MKGYLLDTNMVSMLSPSYAGDPSRFLAWLDGADAGGDVFLSVVTVHEMEKGVAMLARKGATARADALGAWISGLLSAFEDRILAVDVAVSVASGRLEARALANGHSPGMADALIAGIAKVHDLVIVTRNRRHFEPFGMDLLPDDF